MKKQTNIKRAAAFVMAAAMLFSLTACGGGGDNPQVTDEAASVTEETSKQETTASEEADKPEETVAEYEGEPEEIITYKDIFSCEFESEGDTEGFEARGSETVEISTDRAHKGNSCLYVSNRTGTWNGPAKDVFDTMVAGKKYKISAWIMYSSEQDGAKAEMPFYCRFDKDFGTEYLDITSKTIKADVWQEITAEASVQTDIKGISLYFDTEWNTEPEASDLISFYVDDITVSEVIVDSKIVPSIAEVYKDYFSIGVSVVNSDLASPAKTELINKHYNSLTMGNEMKPDAILDYETCVSDLDKYNECPAVKFDRAKTGLDYAKENNIPLRGHTLVWHSQTPSWFFKVDYSRDSDAELVSKEVMLKRMENYIRQVMEYTNENYPGVIYCWDVVNEAMLTGDGQENGYRTKDSLWYQTCGEEYVEKAFEYARKYAPEGTKLFYNDFNTYETPKTFAICNLLEKLIEQGTVDGMGMQSHIGLDYPQMSSYEAALAKFGALGLEIHVTELDMKNVEQNYDAQASKYKRLFMIYKNYVDTGRANITNVTFWGVSDASSWLDEPDAKAYPMLFDGYLAPKSAFYGAICDDSIPLF